MNLWEFILGIILIGTVASLIRVRMGVRRDNLGNEYSIRGGDDAETARLREEVRTLRERLQVIERITVEKENSLEREIERLRDK
jgi:hypothetical protein